MCLFVHNKYIPLNINTCQTLYLIFVKPELIKVLDTLGLDIMGLDILGTTPFFSPTSHFSFHLFCSSLSVFLHLHPPSPLLLPPAPPGQVDNTTVRSENLSLNRTQLTWDAPEDNNARITNYWITYCIPIIYSTNDSCVGQTTIFVRDPTVPMVEFTDISPQRRYRVTIQAENVAGRGPESQPYFFDSPTAGRYKLVTLENLTNQVKIWVG